MNSVLEILISRKDAILVELEQAEKDILDWKEFLQKKDGSFNSTNPPKSNSVAGNLELGLEKTLLENILDVIDRTNGEMYSSEMVDILKSIYPNKDKGFIQRRVSAELSDANKEGLLYSAARKDENQHHLAKVWGLTRFKGTDGKVKEEHKYKSTR
jgi:hypothetical protein